MGELDFLVLDVCVYIGGGGAYIYTAFTRESASFLLCPRVQQVGRYRCYRARERVN